MTTNFYLTDIEERELVYRIASKFGFKVKSGFSNSIFTLKVLLLALIKDDGLEFSQLVQEVKKSPSTVSLYLSQLVEDELVEIKLVELKKRYHIKVRDTIDKLIEDYRPSILEKPASGFEDIINSF